MTSSAQRSSGFLITLATLTALLHAVLGLTAVAEKSMTADEIAHLTAGHAYNTLADFRLQPENGNLPQRWAALPALLIRPPLPATTSATWRRADVWNYGYTFFYEQVMPADELLFWGRAMISFFSAATALLVFGWSYSIFGWRGAFLSLILFTFCPTFLAHGTLATSDVTMAFFFLASIGAWWRQLEQPSIRCSLISALTLGLACVAKFSAILLAPMFALLSLIWLIGQVSEHGWRAPLLQLIASALMHVLVAWAIIWIFYGFRFSAFSPALAEGASFYRGDWNWILTDLGWLQPVIITLRDWHVLPEAFLYGFTFVVQFARERSAFLSGEYSVTGWLGFFPFAFMVKTTLPLLFLLFAGLVAWLRQSRRLGSAAIPQLRKVVPLLVLFLLYWVYSITSHLNIGHRHLLPIYPVLFILLGALGVWIDWRKPVALLTVAGLTVWHIGESLCIRPHYLAYFNQIVGGPSNGWRHLVDSSLDWGQDLPGLKTWLETHAKNEKVFLSYFGSGDPAYEGIKAVSLPSLPTVGPARPWRKLEPGIYAISATMLQNVYMQQRGQWTSENERRYQGLKINESVFLAFAEPANEQSETLPGPSISEWKNAWNLYSLLRFARLCHYLRAREPDAMIGYSILVYRLDQTELDGAINGDLRQLATAIEHAPHAGNNPILAK